MRQWEWEGVDISRLVKMHPFMRPPFRGMLLRHQLCSRHSRNTTENTAPEPTGSMVEAKEKTKFPLGGAAVNVGNGVLQENPPLHPGLGGGRLLRGSDS